MFFHTRHGGSIGTPAFIHSHKASTCLGRAQCNSNSRRSWHLSAVYPQQYVGFEMSRNLDLVRLLSQRNASSVAAMPAKSSSPALPVAVPAKSSSPAPPVAAAAASSSSAAVVNPAAGSGGNSTQTASGQSGPSKSDGDSKQRLLSIYGGKSAKAPKPKGAPKAKPEAVPKAPQPKPVTKLKDSKSAKGGPGLKRPAGRVLKRPASRETETSDPPLKRPAGQCDSDQPDDDMQHEEEESEGPHTGSSSQYSGQTPSVMFLNILQLSEPYFFLAP